MGVTVEAMQSDLTKLIGVGLVKKGTKLPADLAAAAQKFKEVVVSIDVNQVQGNEERTKTYNGIVSKDPKWGGSGLYVDVDAEFPDAPDEGDQVADGSPPTEDVAPDVQTNQPSGGDVENKGKGGKKKAAAKKGGGKPAAKKDGAKRGRPPVNVTVARTAKKVKEDEKVAPQAQGILKALDGLKNGCSREELFKRMEKHVTSKQPMERIYNWYRKDLLDAGLISEKENG